MVKWKGYTDEENSWEPWKGLKSARRLIRKFEKGREKEREKEGEKERKNAKERERGREQQKEGEKEDEKSGIPLSMRSPFVLPLSTQPSRRIPKDVNCILGCRDSPLSNEYEYWVAWKGRSHPH